MRTARNMMAIRRQVVRSADLGATFVFATEGALVAMAARLDPVGIMVIAFVSAVGGGIIRDLLMSGIRPAAIAHWSYGVIVMAAATATWFLHAVLIAVPAALVNALDASGLALAAVAGTEKALDHRVHPFVAIFLGTVGGVGGGVMRDVLLNQVPRVLNADIYATAVIAAALCVTGGRALQIEARTAAVAGGLLCLVLRLCAYRYGWHLPIAGG